MSSIDNISEWRPEYFLPRYIADCARQSDFNGILFSRRKHYSENLVLFSWNESQVKPIGGPKLYVYSGVELLHEEESSKNDDMVEY